MTKQTKNIGLFISLGNQRESIKKPQFRWKKESAFGEIINQIGSEIK